MPDASLDQLPKEPSDDIGDMTPRRTWRYIGVGPAHPDDWSHFDIKNVLRILRIGSAAQARLTLRTHPMVARIHGSYDKTSRKSRSSQRGSYPHTRYREYLRDMSRVGKTTTTELSYSFNNKVEADLMLYHQCNIFHMIDRCTRRYHAV